MEMRKDKRSGQASRFPIRVERIDQACGLEAVSTEAFLTGESPSEKTWGLLTCCVEQETVSDGRRPRFAAQKKNT